MGTVTAAPVLLLLVILLLLLLYYYYYTFEFSAVIIATKSKIIIVNTFLDKLYNMYKKKQDKPRC